QDDLRMRAVDGEIPSVARDVPVELVVIAKEAELAVRVIVEFVGMLAGRQHHVGASQVYPHAVATRFGAPGLRLTVARRGLEIEWHHGVPTTRARVGSGEIAIDAALDLLALGAHPDGFVHVERAIAADGDRAVV